MDEKQARIHTGQYDESLDVTHRVILQADSSSLGTVDVVGDGVSPVMVVAATSNVTVRRLNFSDGGRAAGIFNSGVLSLAKA